MAKILIAAHNQTTAHYLKTEMKKAGHSVDHVDNCLDAWRQSALNSYDVFMVDVIMPGIDSFVLAQRALQQNPDMQIIFLTGFAGVAMETFSDPGHIPFTSRPFHLKDIAARVRYLMGMGGMPQTSSRVMNQDNVVYPDFTGGLTGSQQMQQ